MQCQKCRVPLRLDTSLEDLNAAALKLIVDSTNTPTTYPQAPRSRNALPAYQHERQVEYEAASQAARQPQFQRSTAVGRTAISSNPNMSFVMLPDSQVGDEAGTHEPTKSQTKVSSQSVDHSDRHDPSYRMDGASRVFEILSARSDIDHPICVECSDLLMEGLQKRLNSTNKERDAYVEFLRETYAEIPTEEEVKEAGKRVKQAKKRREVAIVDLEELEREKRTVEEELENLDKELAALDEEEQQFWFERNAHAMELSEFQSERDRINTQFEHDNKLLCKLQRANVYNDTFSIGHDGSFGTINGLRLGKLPDRPVEWSEINAAWGQTCLLLDTVAEKLEFRFHGYEVRPIGSTSRIIEHLGRRPGSSRSASDAASSERCKSHELYSSGEYAISIGLFNRKFDTAMVAFLECLRQLIQHALKMEVRGADGKVIKCPSIPYTIDKDKIGDVSIKLGGFNQDTWTKACKCTLICCKYLLAHASNVTELVAR